MNFVGDLRFAFRSLTRAKGLALTVILTLGLGIGANAAMFSVVRVVLLRPLVNRDESRLIYIRQSAPGIDAENITFSVPELIDLRSRLTTVTALGDFSTIGFTMVGGGLQFAFASHDRAAPLPARPPRPRRRSTWTWRPARSGSSTSSPNPAT